jgi:hypothetical protein
MRLRRAIASACVGVAIAIFASCKEPTAIAIEARTNAPPQSVKGTTFTVRAPDVAENAPPQAQTSSVDASGFIGSLVAVPKDADDSSVVVKVVVGLDRPAEACSRTDGYKGCIVARRRLSYVPGETLRLPIFLDVACRDIACNDSSTCRGGLCVSSVVSCSGSACEAPGELVDGGTILVDAPTSPDVSVPLDAAGDAMEAGPDYSGVVCNGKVCPRGNVCCIEGSKPGFCLTANDTCPIVTVGVPMLRVECDGPEDCRGGNRCCATATLAACQPACMSDDKELCHSKFDCTTKSQDCVPAATPSGYSECR